MRAIERCASCGASLAAFGDLQAALASLLLRRWLHWWPELGAYRLRL